MNKTYAQKLNNTLFSYNLILIKEMCKEDEYYIFSGIKWDGAYILFYSSN